MGKITPAFSIISHDLKIIQDPNALKILIKCPDDKMCLINIGEHHIDHDFTIINVLYTIFEGSARFGKFHSCLKTFPFVFLYN